jgi:ribonuclease D
MPKATIVGPAYDPTTVETPMASDLVGAMPDHDNFYYGDLPDAVYEQLKDCTFIGVDTETLGLHLHRDRLAMVQLQGDNGVFAMVKITDPFLAVNLVKLLESPVTKLFHFARFDLGRIALALNTIPTAVFCTKVASKLVRTFGASHSYGPLVEEATGVKLDKGQATSYWGGDNFKPAQIDYARNDVRYLIEIKDYIMAIAEREGLGQLVREAMIPIPYIVKNDVHHYGLDVYEH